MNELQELTDLSLEFGAPDYVLGGGGNTSFKIEDTLWVKPSGLALKDMTPGRFVAMDRARLDALYAWTPPSDKQVRESAVKDALQDAVRPDSEGRPSVEALLHHTFTARFVVHTHPALVNGLTCARNGERACRDLFPDALWFGYCDPGYTLSMGVREALSGWREDHGRDPGMVFLQNHGVFVAGNAPEELRTAYRQIMERLAAHYREAGIPTALAEGPAPDPDRAADRAGTLRGLLGEEAAAVEAGGPFTVSRGPLSPDHMVYARSFPLEGEPDQDSVRRHLQERGAAPRVAACPEGVYGLGRSPLQAGLALVFARDAALVVRLANAFGGVRYLGDEERLFIENWEVEAYRARAIETS